MRLNDRTARLPGCSYDVECTSEVSSDPPDQWVLASAAADWVHAFRWSDKVSQQLKRQGTSLCYTAEENRNIIVVDDLTNWQS